MRLGVVIESHQEASADRKVLECIIRRLCPEIELEFRGNTNKAFLVQDIAKHCKFLFEEMKCDRVLVGWDLYPAFGGRHDRPCMKRDREAILSRLTEEGIVLESVSLLAMVSMLESLFLEVPDVISTFLSTSTHRVNVPKYKNAERNQKPKAWLDKYFSQSRYRQYSDLEHAERLIQKVTDLNKLKGNSSFSRLRGKIECLCYEK